VRRFASLDDFVQPSGHDNANETTEVKRMLTALIQELSAES
jgi:hypothetical protein